MSGLDYVVLAILSTTAIVIIGFAVKACHILNKDWRRGHSLLELKPGPPTFKEIDLKVQSTTTGPTTIPTRSSFKVTHEIHTSIGTCLERSPQETRQIPEMPI